MKVDIKNSLGVFRVVLALGALLLISGCSYFGLIPGADKVIGEEGFFRDSQSDYLEAQTIPRTVIPADMDSYIIDDLLVVPNLAGQEVEAFLETPRPRGMSGNPERGVVIQRINNRNWVVVDASASQVWPRVRDYWNSKGISLSYENPTAGILDTEWFVQDGNVLTREKMRAVIEPGFQNNSSEIRLLHLSSAQATPIGLVPDRWPEVSVDLDLEYDILTSLSEYLADVADLYQASSVSFLAGNISSEGKATITTNSEGDSLLRLEADYDRSWAAVGQALARAGIEILTEDADLGTYDVSYTIDVEEEEERGFLMKALTLNGLFSGSDERLYHSLQVELREAGNRVDIFIDVLEGEPETDTSVLENAQESLLERIRNFIA